MSRRRLARELRRVAIAGALLVALLPERPALAGEFTVLYERGRITVVAEDVALGDVVREVGRQAGVEVQGTDDLRDSVTIRFAGASLDEALRRLLAGVSHVLVVEPTPAGGQPRPTQAHVFGSRRPGQAPAVFTGRPVPREPVAEPTPGTAAEGLTDQEVATFGPAALTPGAEDELLPPTAER